MKKFINKTAKTAIALEYNFADDKGDRAPRVTAKGSGSVAEKIIETARAHKIAIEENAILAEALSSVELEEQIPENLYRAVAQVLSFVLFARKTIKS